MRLEGLLTVEVEARSVSPGIWSSSRRRLEGRDLGQTRRADTYGGADMPAAQVAEEEEQPSTLTREQTGPSGRKTNSPSRGNFWWIRACTRVGIFA